MHDAAYTFVMQTVRGLTPKRVVEFGSYNVNGSVRPLFWGALSYTGVDLRPGPGVDEVGAACDYLGEPADLVVCCETLEHDRDPQATFRAAFANLKPSGVFILTAAAPERAPHGCDGGALPIWEHYGAIDPRELPTLLEVAGFVGIAITHRTDIGDVYAVAQKPEA